MILEASSTGSKEIDLKIKVVDIRAIGTFSTFNPRYSY